MNKHRAFAIWAPEDALWSRWAKPVLFAHFESAPEQRLATPTHSLEWCPSPSERVALILELPGAQAALLAVPLAKLGYRPVPLYNAIPLQHTEMTELSVRHEAVEVIPIVQALRQGARRLALLDLATDAPPAFLLDADRGGVLVGPEAFDNRSVSFTTDFPSGLFLRTHGITRVIHVQLQAGDPADDLAHTLRAYQEAGIALEQKALAASGPPTSLEVARPAWYRSMFQRALASLGLRRSTHGGFGAFGVNASSG